MPFDLGIDNGSHQVHHVLATFRYLYPRLPPPGIYLVEDTQPSFLHGAGGNSHGADTIFSVAHDLTQATHRREGFAGPSADRLAGLADISHAVRVYRNMIMFERGDNTYPSNFGFDLNHPGSIRTRHGMARDARSHPSSRDCLSRIDMLIWGGDPARAVIAAETYPGDAALLSELVRLMEWAGRHPGTQEFGDRPRRLTG